MIFKAAAFWALGITVHARTCTHAIIAGFGSIDAAAHMSENNQTQSGINGGQQATVEQRSKQTNFLLYIKQDIGRA